MQNAKQLIILIISFSLILVLTSCTKKPDIRELPVDIAKALEAELGKFSYLDAWTDSRERIQYKRIDIDEETGKPAFSTRVIKEPIRILEFGKVTPLSVVSVILNDGNETFCNIIKIDGSPEKSICKIDNSDTKTKFYREKISSGATHNNSENNLASQNLIVKRLSDSLEKKLNNLTNKTGKEIGFFTVFNSETKKFRIIPHGNHNLLEYANQDISIILGVTSSATVTYERNPCCSLDANNVEHCQHICF